MQAWPRDRGNLRVWNAVGEPVALLIRGKPSRDAWLIRGEINRNTARVLPESVWERKLRGDVADILEEAV